APPTRGGTFRPLRGQPLFCQASGRETPFHRHGRTAAGPAYRPSPADPRPPGAGAGPIHTAGHPLAFRHPPALRGGRRPSMILDLLIVLGLVLLNGFFAMSEMAVVTARKARLRAVTT